jgi:hypothetical protein
MNISITYAISYEVEFVMLILFLQNSNLIRINITISSFEMSDISNIFIIIIQEKAVTPIDIWYIF